MGATDNAVNRSIPTAAEVSMRRSNRYAYIRQLYIDELRYNSGKFKDKKIPANQLKEIKHKIRRKLKREARMRVTYAAIFTVIIVGVLGVALALLVRYY